VWAGVHTPHEQVALGVLQGLVSGLLQQEANSVGVCRKSAHGRSWNLACGKRLEGEGGLRRQGAKRA
jgi:hypothetical protein